MTSPAGWYPDPSKANQYRWWDGAAWTDYTHAGSGQLLPPPPASAVQPTPQPPPPPPPPGVVVPPFAQTVVPEAVGGKANYGRRVGAWFLDIALVCCPAFVATIVAFAVAGTTNVQINSDGTGNIHGAKAAVVVILLVLGPVSALVLAITNQVLRQGRTGQSWGKRVMGIALVSSGSRAPAGAGRVFARYLLTGLFGALSCYIFTIIDFLWPLWDDGGQRVLDKMLNTVVVPESAMNRAV